MKPRTAAALASLLTFLLYRATLLPGFDFGDTGSFQVMAGSGAITPRDAYPFYFAVGDIVLWLVGGDHAHAFNLASALEAAIACGLIVVAATELSGSLVAGVTAALFFAGSYTFWSQAVIAEVYALHMVFLAGTVCLLLRWERQPTTRRLAAFFALYALGFGNHLSMILLMPAYALFLLVGSPGGWRAIVNRRVVGIALVAAVAGALQYSWNLRSLWLAPVTPSSAGAAWSQFWFDATKVDWRETIVASIPRAMIAERFRMYEFDVIQQFGSIGAGLALVGGVALLLSATRRALLLLTIYLANAAFALSYNVGDTHVFLLPTHLVTALSLACGVAAIQRVTSSIASQPGWLRAAPALVFAGVAVARIWDNYPALDRSDDRRPRDMLAALTAGLDDRQTILLEDLNWQIENGLTYFSKWHTTDVAWARMPDVLPYRETLIADNLAIGRSIAVTAAARSSLNANLSRRALDITPDPLASPSSLAEFVREIPVGTRYVLCLLKPSRDYPLDERDFDEALAVLAPGIDPVARDDYFMVAGQSGEPPIAVRSSSRPFRTSFDLQGVPVDIRMESWLAFDTIRRMGFAQVVAGHRHALIVERGVSFVALDGSGRPIQSTYAASLFAPPLRYLIRALRRVQ